MQHIKNQKGFTLIDTLIAMVVLAVGILGLAAMQCRAMHQNRYAWDRTQANAVALAVLEELKRLPFDAPLLADGGGDLNAGMPAAPGDDPEPEKADHMFYFDAPLLADGGGNLNADMPAAPGDDPEPEKADHMFNKANFPALAQCYQLDAQNNLKNESGKTFRLFWNVQQSTIIDGTNTYTPCCTIRLFMYWQNALGPSHLEMTTVKYNNLKV